MPITESRKCSEFGPNEKAIRILTFVALSLKLDAFYCELS